jgi:hypothetical protein
MNKIIFNIPNSKRPTDNTTRYIKRVDKNGITENIGVLRLEYNQTHRNEDLYKKLSYEDIIQCKEFIHIYNKSRRNNRLSSNKTFKANAFYLDENFVDMLYSISVFADNQGEQFYPKNIMYDAVLDKLEKLNKKLDLSDIFEKYDFDTSHTKRLINIDHNNRIDTIKLFLSLDSDKDKLIQSLNDRLKDFYDINKDFTLKMIEELITRKDRGIKAYIMSACIDIIDRYGINPILKIDAGTIFYYWYMHRLDSYTSHQAIKQFSKEFEPNNDQMDSILLACADLVSKK